MKDTDQQIEQGLRDMPEIPFTENLRWNILEAAHDLSLSEGKRPTSKRPWQRRWKPFAASFAGVAVAALVVVGVLQHDALRSQPSVTMATIPPTEVGLKPADVTVTNVHAQNASNKTTTVYATVTNNSDHVIDKYSTFAVLWLGGTANNPLSAESLIIANGAGSSLNGDPSDDNGPVKPHQTIHWHFHVAVSNSAAYAAEGVHVHFFVAGKSAAHMETPVVTWQKAPLVTRYVKDSVDPRSTSKTKYVNYYYMVTNTGDQPIDLKKVWGIDWFDKPGQHNPNWDDPGVTRYADIPHLSKNVSSILAPNQTVEVSFHWTIPGSIESIIPERPKLFFVEQ